MTAIKRLKALAGAADVDIAKRKLLADISRAMTMTQTSVSKGDATAKQYQAKLQKLKSAVNECTTMAQVQKIRDQLSVAQAGRRSGATAAKPAAVGDRVKVIDEFYYGLKGKIQKLGDSRNFEDDEIKLDNGKVVKTRLWYNISSVQQAGRRQQFLIKTPFVLDVSNTIQKKTLNIQKNDVLIVEDTGRGHPQTGPQSRVWLWDPMNPKPIFTYVVGQAVVEEIIKHSK